MCHAVKDIKRQHAKDTQVHLTCAEGDAVESLGKELEQRTNLAPMMP